MDNLARCVCHISADPVISEYISLASDSAVFVHCAVGDRPR